MVFPFFSCVQLGLQIQQDFFQAVEGWLYGFQFQIFRFAVSARTGGTDAVYRGGPCAGHVVAVAGAFVFVANMRKTNDFAAASQRK